MEAIIRFNHLNFNESSTWIGWPKNQNKIGSEIVKELVINPKLVIKQS